MPRTPNTASSGSIFGFNRSQVLCPSKRASPGSIPAAIVKEKVISARVYPDMLEKFSRINKAQGMTNASVINQLIAKYVRDKEGWLRE